MVLAFFCILFALHSRDGKWGGVFIFLLFPLVSLHGCICLRNTYLPYPSWTGKAPARVGLGRWRRTFLVFNACVFFFAFSFFIYSLFLLWIVLVYVYLGYIFPPHSSSKFV